MIVAASLFLATRGDDSNSVASRAHRIESKIRCVDCQSLSIADSESVTAVASRAEVVRRVRAGETDDEIVKTFVDRYGPFVLLKPSSHGIGLLVWLLPIVALAIAASSLLLLFLRWRREPQLTPTRADEELVEAVRRERAASESTAPGADRASSEQANGERDDARRHPKPLEHADDR